MDEVTQARIFQAYERGHEQIDGEGLGLCLSTCKQLVELHGGELSIQSALGRGSVFLFSLPLANSPSLPSAPIIEKSRTVNKGGLYHPRYE
jgi:two-component system sensor histidine kinase ChiS